MGAIFMVFGSAVIIVTFILLSRSPLKRALRQRKIQAALAMMRQSPNKIE